MPIYLYPENQGRNPFKVALSFPINNVRKNIFEAYKYYDKCFQRKNLWNNTTLVYLLSNYRQVLNIF